ncbi:MAG: sugar transferase [Verrucomicrobiota bacterium]
MKPLVVHNLKLDAFISDREFRESSIRSITLALFIGDAIAFLTGLFYAYWLFLSQLVEIPFVGLIGGEMGFYPQVLSLYVSMMIFMILAKQYKRKLVMRPLISICLAGKTLTWWTVSFCALSLSFEMSETLPVLYVLLSSAIMFSLLVCWRYFLIGIIVRKFFARFMKCNTMVIGYNDRVQKIIEFSRSKESLFPLNITRVVSPSGKTDLSRLPDEVQRWGGLQDYSAVIASGGFDTVLLADSEIPLESKVEIQKACAREMVDFMVLPDDIITMSSCLSIETVQGVPLLTQSRRPLDSVGNAAFKRFIDIVGGLFGLAIFSPVIAYFSWRVYRESPGPVFYRQVRTARNGQEFEIIKIRSMRLDAESATGAKWCQENDPRRLKIGAFMRKYNIDELPQFWNVLKGEMSLVGPRPERPELIKNFKSNIDYYNLRHTVKPGLTGWAQVNGWRGDTDLGARIACDIEYIERANFWLDIVIMLKTFKSNKNAY